jgi:hypothetical protein
MNWKITNITKLEDGFNYIVSFSVSKEDKIVESNIIIKNENNLQNLQEQEVVSLVKENLDFYSIREEYNPSKVFENIVNK